MRGTERKGEERGGKERQFPANPPGDLPWKRLAAGGQLPASRGAPRLSGGGQPHPGKITGEFPGKSRGGSRKIDRDRWKIRRFRGILPIQL